MWLDSWLTFVVQFCISISKSIDFLVCGRLFDANKVGMKRILHGVLQINFALKKKKQLTV
jgi:hypothetical protein